MNNEVTVTIIHDNDEVRVMNDKGYIWSFKLETPQHDPSTAGTIASLVAAQLAGTITAHLLHMDETKIKYRLEVLTGADAR